MGDLVEGRWQVGSQQKRDKDGRFVPAQSQWRDWITADGAAGNGRARSFKAEPGRFHLYVSLACPWAHRTLIFRALKKLERVISISIVHPIMGDSGWTFLVEDGATGDTLYDLDFLYQIYTKAQPIYSGRVTVPVLWDKREQTIVNNESSEIIRMLNTAFDSWGDAGVDFYPKPLRVEIDALNELIYSSLNIGVYKAGFATSQAAYEEAFREVFRALDELERRLSKQRYLIGDHITEADWRLFTSLVRFDPIYFGHFKCNLRRISDYPNLSNYLRDLFQLPGIPSTVNLRHIKSNYYGSQRAINPTGITPLGPELNFDAPHDRHRFEKSM